MKDFCCYWFSYWQWRVVVVIGSPIDSEGLLLLLLVFLFTVKGCCCYWFSYLQWMIVVVIGPPIYSEGLFCCYWLSYWQWRVVVVIIICLPIDSEGLLLLLLVFLFTVKGCCCYWSSYWQWRVVSSHPTMDQLICVFYKWSVFSSSHNNTKIFLLDQIKQILKK